MMKSPNIARLASIVTVVALAAAAPASAGSINVSAIGVDSGSCGGSDAPCATIAQAVLNAADGDTIAVGPGVYAGATVAKALTLVSSAGTGAAIINSPMLLNFQGIELGKRGKGFSFAVAGTAVSINSDETVVRGNRFSDGTIGVEINVGTGDVVRDNIFDDVDTGVSNVFGEQAVIRGNEFGYASVAAVDLGAGSTGATVRENRTHGPSGAGFRIDGTDHLLFRNQVNGSPGGGFVSNGTPTGVQLVENIVVSSGSPAYWLTTGSGWILDGNAAVNNTAPGFYFLAATTLVATGNIAIGNSAYGFLVSGGSDHVLTGNTSINNIGPGIVLGGVGTGVVITGGNLYGNVGNCGLDNSSASTVTTADVFWGDPAGPGADPADALCGNTVAIVVESSADAPAKVKMPSIK